jgi:hypothetical protein
MNLTTDTLQFVGQALYGPVWHSALADALDVNERSVRRWANGTNEIPVGVWSDIAILCRQHGKELEQWARSLDC